MESDADTDAESDGNGETGSAGVGDAVAESDGDGDAESDGVGNGESDGDGDTDGDAESDAVGVGEADTDGDADSAGGSRNSDGDGDGLDSGGDGWLGVTVQRKLTEPVAPDADVAVTVTVYVPDAVDEMVPVISPLLVIDKPGGRFDTANCGDCPSAALSDVTCTWIAVPAAFCWLLGLSRRTAAWRK